MWVNFVLAVLPGIGAFLLHRLGHRLGSVRWPAVVAVGLLLPNAPYVVTDLIHLQSYIQSAPTRLDVWAGVLPLFTVLIATGVLSYAYTIHVVRKHMKGWGWSRRAQLVAEGLLDTACAVGLALGRVSRLNSWDVVQPSRLAHGLAVIASDPRSLVLSLAVVILAGFLVDRLASATVHTIRDRLRHH